MQREIKNNNLFFSNVNENNCNRNIISDIETYHKDNPNKQIYLITSPLGSDYSYDYEDRALVILSPKHKIIFLNLNSSTKQNFENYYEDFIEDVGFISDKFDYKKVIGRPKEWKKELTITFDDCDSICIKDIFSQTNIEDVNTQRKLELLISLLIGSVNDVKNIKIEEPKTLLQKVKNRIILFDGEQTRFIYQDIKNKNIFIQGLSGSGKTELLLHKLKEIYTTKDNVKVFFTCHNIALSNTIRNRIPGFFNFMKVEKQIEWNKKLWVDRAWGSQKDKNSGLYSYICDFYDIPFYSFSRYRNYEFIFSKALDYINTIEDINFKHAFDYILIDERQDFPDIFFKLCEKITKEKVYIAGDIFQDIFENNIKKKVENVDFILNRCYRTDSKTLMFSQAIGMGLFENQKLNWLEKEEWEACGYKFEKFDNKEIHLSREPVRRFDDLNLDYDSVEIGKFNGTDSVIDIIKRLKKDDDTLEPDDIAIIMLDDDNDAYDRINRIALKITEQMKWNVNKGHESKQKIKDTIFLSNKNNVKGLEFSFAICIGQKIKNDPAYRNTIYTMMTRSFIKSFLLFIDNSGLDVQKQGLDVINEKKYIKTTEPTDEEKNKIKRTIIKYQKDLNISYDQFLASIFNEYKIGSKERKQLSLMISSTSLRNSFERDKIIDFINKNREYIQ